MNKIIISYSIIALLGGIYGNQLLSQSEAPKEAKIALYLQKAYELENVKDEYLFNKSELMYLQAIEKDSLNINVIYNLSVLYYNKSVDLLKLTQKDSVINENLINEAKKYMKLYGIYYDKVDRLKKELKED